jgi:hypothetical protein
VIANRSLEWLAELHSQPKASRKPYFAYIAVKAPHIQVNLGLGRIVALYHHSSTSCQIN